MKVLSDTEFDIKEDVCSSCDSFFHQQTTCQNVREQPESCATPSSSRTLINSPISHHHHHHQRLQSTLPLIDIWKTSSFLLPSTNLQSFRKLLPPFRQRDDSLHCQWFSPQDGKRCERYFRNAEVLARHIIYEHIENIEEDASSTVSVSSMEPSKCRWGVCNESVANLGGHIIKEHLSIHAFACPYKYCRAKDARAPKTMRQLEEHITTFHTNNDANGVNMLPLSIPVQATSKPLRSPPPLPISIPAYKLELGSMIKIGKEREEGTEKRKLKPVKVEQSVFKYPILNSRRYAYLEEKGKLKSKGKGKEKEKTKIASDSRINQLDTQMSNLCSGYGKLGLDRKRKAQESSAKEQSGTKNDLHKSDRKRYKYFK